MGCPDVGSSCSEIQHENQHTPYWRGKTGTLGPRNPIISGLFSPENCTVRKHTHRCHSIARNIYQDLKNSNEIHMVIVRMGGVEGHISVHRCECMRVCMST